uniref:G-protein coupled receptors family 1 profile domain-containing protein n=1 Tax=Anopheles farauti TaxID=69004 RepID=A0A182R0G3_9DIPT
KCRRETGEEFVPAIHPHTQAENERKDIKHNGRPSFICSDPKPAVTRDGMKGGPAPGRMIKMMVTVVIVFTICWLPFNFLMIMKLPSSWDLLPYFWFAFHWLAMSHSCYNPIIYCYMNARFRSGFILVLHGVPGLQQICCCIRHTPPAIARNVGSSVALAGIDEVSHLHRVNTCTTYISTRRKPNHNVQSARPFTGTTGGGFGVDAGGPRVHQGRRKRRCCCRPDDGPGECPYDHQHQHNHDQRIELIILETNEELTVVAEDATTEFQYGGAGAPGDTTGGERA